MVDVPFILGKNIGDDDEVADVLVVSQPIAMRPRGLSREVQALNEMTRGFDGPYWQSKSPRKRRRSAAESGSVEENL